MIAKLAVVAALAGSAIGAAVVLADEPAPAAKVPAVATPHASQQGKPPQLTASNVRMVRQVADPAGGAPWAIRRFSGVYPNARGRALDCIELGRLVDGTFGWIDGTGTFKPAEPGHSEWLGVCSTAKQLERFGAQGTRLTTLALAAGTSPRPLETVTWGAVPPTVTRVLPQGDAPIDAEDGVFLRIAPGEQPAGSLTGTVEHADGHRTRFNRVQLPPYKGERSVAGTEFVAAQAPDPAGGTPWGLIGTRGTDGGLCLNNPGFLVGTRLGHVQDILGVFFSTGLAFLSRCAREPTRGYPMRIDTLIAGGIPDDSAGRIERRVLSNRIVFWGRVYKDVVSVTIRTPRDVRTLVPSSRAHAILAVYDGRFPGGNVTATARLEDGREVTRTLYSE